MKQTYRHIPGVDIRAEFANERGHPFRYWLEVTQHDAKAKPKTAAVIMQNPSYAGCEHADRSVQFMERVVFTQGRPEFAGVQRLIVVNQFALIQTNDFVGNPSDVGRRNDDAIASAFAQAAIIIIGWGRSNPFAERKDFAHSLLSQLKGKKKYQTSSHPSRGRYEGFIQPYVETSR